jgi:hypothetical protein
MWSQWMFGLLRWRVFARLGMRPGASLIRFELAKAAVALAGRLLGFCRRQLPMQR